MTISDADVSVRDPAVDSRMAIILQKFMRGHMQRHGVGEAVEKLQMLRCATVDSQWICLLQSCSWTCIWDASVYDRPGYFVHGISLSFSNMNCAPYILVLAMTAVQQSEATGLLGGSTLGSSHS